MNITYVVMYRLNPFLASIWGIDSADKTKRILLLRPNGFGIISSILEFTCSLHKSWETRTIMAPAYGNDFGQKAFMIMILRSWNLNLSICFVNFLRRRLNWVYLNDQWLNPRRDSSYCFRNKCASDITSRSYLSEMVKYRQ